MFVLECMRRGVEDGVVVVLQHVRLVPGGVVNLHSDEGNIWCEANWLQRVVRRDLAKGAWPMV